MKDHYQPIQQAKQKNLANQLKKVQQSECNQHFERFLLEKLYADNYQVQSF